MHPLLKKAQHGFASSKIGKTYQTAALRNLNTWLTQKEFKPYLPQLEHVIAHGHWDYLLDCFYQVIPFGTGGRRGEVGPGPNRINPWTIKASAQGHSQYLLKKHGADAKKRGVVFTYDVREFTGNAHLNNTLNDPLKGLTSKDLAIAAAEVYAANGIRVHLFQDVRTTPELSFAIRHLGAVAGDMFSASHNPADHNGKKVYDETGGQLIPPHDQNLVDEVTKNVKHIKQMPFKEAMRKKLVLPVGAAIDKAYITAAKQVSLSSARAIKIAYTPLHGCGMSSVYAVLKALKFNVQKDPRTSNASGKFEHVTFRIPNPEVIQSFDTTLTFAKKINADIILNSDPDADRIGIMVKHKKEWVFLNGNEIAIIIADYVVQKKKDALNGRGVMVKTTVTTNLLKRICEQNGVQLMSELLIGFKYIGDHMNKMEQEGRINDFLFACEESHGYIAGNYSRDKDAVVAAVWLAERAAELKKEKKTLVDELDRLSATYGYVKNYLTEVRLLGASGKEKIDHIQKTLRTKPPKAFGRFRVKAFQDRQKDKPIVSPTDRTAKDVLIFHLAPPKGIDDIKVTVRPSGTEPKTKMYFEVMSPPCTTAQLPARKKQVEQLLNEVEKAVMRTCYGIINIDFPERGFLLFWQLPLDTKMRYFQVEPDIAKCKTIKNRSERQKTLNELLKFLGADPVQKVNAAFQAKYKKPLLSYLNLGTH